MNACRPKGNYVTADAQYINRKYVQEVGVISTHDYRHSLEHDHVTLNESQLIENAKLTSSEREVNKLRLSGSFDVNDDVFDADFKTQEQDEKVSADGSKEQDEDFISAVEDDKDDAAMFYETQTDESTLIKYAKLTDDALDEAVKCSGKLIHDIVCANEQELKVPLKMSDENADGFKTPVNSEDGERTIEVIKKKLPTCFQVSHEINTKEDKREVSLYKQSPRLRKVVADTAEQRVVRRNIHAGEITDADEEPRDVDFCKLVDEVVGLLQDCDLDEMLSMFAGSGILEMTGLVPPADLLDILQRHRLISRDNLFHLQGLIIRLDDADLYTKAVQYTRHHHDAVHFYQDKDITTKGFGKVRCFVGGHDFTRITREDIELVRFKVASLVFMPAHFVYIVGIEPGLRVVVTLMLLERYVQELLEMAKEGLAELSLVKVDAVQIYGKTYSTTGTTAIEKYREGGHASFLSVYQQLRDKSKRLEERDAEVRKLREDAELKQLELETMGAELELLTEKALHESVVRKRFQNQPVNRHSRTRSFPLSYREDSYDKNFAQALESAVVANSIEHVPELNSQNRSMKVKNTIKLTRSSHGHKSVLNEGAVTVIPCVDRSEYNLFHETNELMKDIEAILGELALGSGK